MIGKVIRGTGVRGLLYYLYGPGRANEHTRPHLVAGFGDPAELEPERRPGRVPDVRRLAGLLNQPLAALAGEGYAKPVWHCPVRAAPEDRELSDAEWAQVARQIMDTTGLAPAGDELGVRWVAVRHASDHIHLVATLARQDGTRPRIWNDFYRLRDACRQAEHDLGLRATAPADRTAARRPSRAETEQTTRRGWPEAPRTTLRRTITTAAAGASSEQEFFARLREAGVVLRLRHSVRNPGEVTGYAAGLPQHRARDGGIIWYSGGKLAADLTLPKLRARWATPTEDTTAGLSPTAVRGALRTLVAAAAERAHDEAGFFARLRESGAVVRLRYSEINSGEVTGYAVTLPNHTADDGTPLWYGGGRLAPGLTLPRLRTRWNPPRNTAPEHGTPRLTGPERDAIYRHAAEQAASVAEHLRHCAATDPAAGADAAWAAGDALHAAASALGSHILRRTADSYDRASRAPYGRVPRRTRHGDHLRAAGRLLALTRHATHPVSVPAGLAANLLGLVGAVADLRDAQQHAAQAAAARHAAEQLREAVVAGAGTAPATIQPERTRPDRTARDFPLPFDLTPEAASPGSLVPRTSPSPRRPNRRHAGPPR